MYIKELKETRFENQHYWAEKLKDKLVKHPEVVAATTGVCCISRNSQRSCGLHIASAYLGCMCSQVRTPNALSREKEK